MVKGMLSGGLIGQKKARARLKLLAGPTGLQLSADQLLEGVANAIVLIAKALVPKDTMQTHDSIRAEREGHLHWVVRVDRLGNHPLVPIFLEFGTMHMAARPFLRPAGDIALAGGGLRRILRSTGGLLVRSRVF